MTAPAQKAIEEGIALYNAGRYAEATRLFKIALAAGGGPEINFFLEKIRRSLTPNPDQAYVGAPAQEQRLREFARARDYDSFFRELETLFAQDINLGYRLARDYWLNGALGDLPNKKNISAWIGFFLSSAAWRHGDNAEALRLLNTASRANDRYRWMRYFIAEILLRRHDLFSCALMEVEEVLRTCLWLWEAHCLRSEILMAMGSEKGLLALARVKVPPASEPAFLAWRGAQRFWSGRALEALPDLDAAAALGNPDALCWRGGARVLLGRIDEALADLDRLLAHDPKDPEALVWRGEALRLSGQNKAARVDLDTAITLYPDSIWALVNRALLNLDESNLKGARADFARLAPPTYVNVPDDPKTRRPLPPSHYFPEIKLTPARMKTLLRSALRLARGCRRADTHLNISWMQAAGIPLPPRATPQARLLYWMRWKKLPTSDVLPFGPDTLSEEQALQACGRTKGRSRSASRA